MTDTAPVSGQQRRAFWLKHLHQWHWISSAICLIGMLMFAITGFTLNHAAQIEARPSVVTRSETAPRDVVSALRRAAPSGVESKNQKGIVPPALAEWLDAHLPPMVEGMVAAEIRRIAAKKS